MRVVGGLGQLYDGMIGYVTGFDYGWVLGSGFFGLRIFRRQRRTKHTGMEEGGVSARMYNTTIPFGGVG